MAILRAKDIKSMSVQDRNLKIKELKFELVKAGVTSQKGKAKTKELRRTIARLLTFNKMTDGGRTNK